MLIAVWRSGLVFFTALAVCVFVEAMIWVSKK